MSNFKINELTQQQKDLIPQFYDGWLKRALDTDPVDRELAEKGIKLSYFTIGETKEPKIEWLKSPFEGLTGALLLSEEKASGELISKELWATELDRARDVIMKQIAPDVIRTLKTALMENIAERAAAVVLPVVTELEQHANGKDNATQIIRELNRQALFGSFDAGWFSFYDYLDRVLGIAECQRLKGLFLASKAGWYWPFKSVVLATEHPNKLLLDDKGKPHCTDSAAITYSDGFSVHCWHGVRVPEEAIVEPGKVNWDEVLKTPDDALKNALADIKAANWAKKGNIEEVTEREDAATAVRRLGGVEALKDMTESEC